MHDGTVDWSAKYSLLVHSREKGNVLIARLYNCLATIVAVNTALAGLGPPNHTNKVQL